MNRRILKFLHLEHTKISWRIFLLLLMPLAIFFSYHPLISFGQTAGTNLEISILEIYLIVFAIANLKPIWQNRQLLAGNKFVWLALAFALISTLSLLWTANPTKGILITGLIWLLFLCLLSIMSYQNLKKLTSALTEILYVASGIFCLFALYQFIAETFGLPAQATLLCSGCRATELGFPRVTGLSIEPQFFASLLLIPTLLLIRNLTARKAPTLLLFATTIFLTLSRGAIYALIIALLLFFVLSLKKLQKPLAALALIAASFLISLSLQGLSAHLNPATSDTFYAAISRTIHQLSLGLIDIRPNKNPSSTTEVEAPKLYIVSELPEQPKTPDFDGYIEESTTTRNHLTSLSLQAWAKNPRNVIIGTGTGSTGYILHAYFPDQIGSTEITQNQYTETLLETGLLGLLLTAILIILLFRATLGRKYLWPIFAAILTQWFFFSGYPNALHIYLFFALCIAISPKQK